MSTVMPLNHVRKYKKNIHSKIKFKKNVKKKKKMVQQDYAERPQANNAEPTKQVLLFILSSNGGT